MQTNKFHKRKQVKRHLTHIVSNREQERNFESGSEYHGKSGGNFENRQGTGGQQTVLEEQQFQPTFFPQITMTAPSQGAINQAGGQFVQHVMIPVPVAVGTELPPHMFSPQLIATPFNANQGQLEVASMSLNQSKSFESERETFGEGSQKDDLDYYMDKDHKSIGNKTKARNYRNRRSSSDSFSSEAFDEKPTSRSNRPEEIRSRVSHDERYDHSRDNSPHSNRHAGTHSYDLKHRGRSRSPLRHREERHMGRNEHNSRDRHREERHEGRHEHSSRDRYLGKNRNFVDNRDSEHTHVRDRPYDQRHERSVDNHREGRSRREARDDYDDDYEHRSDRHEDKRESRFERNDRNYDCRDDYLDNVVERHARDIDKRDIVFEDRREHVDEQSLRYRDDRYSDQIHDHSRYSTSERSRSGKRSLSPISPERMSVKSNKYRRDLSPISDSKSHAELKIHVSDTGRWIESDDQNRDLSPVSDGEIIETRREYGRRMLNDRVVVTNTRDESIISDVESVSDEESFSDEFFDNLRNWKSDRYSHGEVDRFDRKIDEGPVLLTDGIKEGLGRRQDTGPVQMTDGKKESDLSQPSDYHDKRRAGNIKTMEMDDGNSGEFSLKLPNPCKYYNTKTCTRGRCLALHVCRPFILETCRYGAKCFKSHSFFTGQAFQVLKELNPGIEIVPGMHHKIVNLLQRRILISCGRSDLLHVIDDKEKELEKRLKPTDMECKNEIESRDQRERNYDRKSDDYDRKSVEQPHKSAPHAYKPRNDLSTSKDEIKSGVRKHGIPDNKIVRRTDRDLSPVSGDEENWDKHERYEKVSDDGMGDEKTKPELDTVSSSGSEDGLNKPVGYQPVPTPENIAVPIGMNDPLVFNRPLGSNPQTYVGPLNRPPPMVPLNQGPLFPVASQDVSKPFGQVMPPVHMMPPRPRMGMPFLGPGGSLPNHLPSLDFMKQIIKNLPPVQNTFKNDNTPAIIEAKTECKKKQVKIDKDPELKETIKSLWKFPHKNIVNMTIIEFVTETEAYKEEFIAEIVKILVTLELPYVTMKKLLSVIKEKVMINIATVLDLKKILELYPAHFKIIETVESDDEDEEETRKRVQIKANVTLGFCEKHGFLPFSIGKCECNALHMCKFYILSNCPNKHCKFGHKLKTEHNIGVLKSHKLHRLCGEELFDFLTDIDNRTKETIPSLCKYYTREKGCYKGDNTDCDTICHGLHICFYALKGKCTNKECERSHSIRGVQPLSLLVKYGLDPDELGDDKVMQMICENLVDVDKDRITRNLPHKNKTEANQKAGGVLINKKTRMTHVKSAPSSNLSKLPTGKLKPVSSRTATQKHTPPAKPRRPNVKVPAICKFYQNEMGCRKKDWGPDGKCHFLHICQYFVSGECKFGDKCKRSHDLFTGQAALLLKGYNIHTERLTVEEILNLLNKTGTPVELPNEGANVDVVDDDYDDEINENLAESSSSQPMAEVKAVEVSVSSENVAKKIQDQTETKTNKKANPYRSSNIEDVIKHIMEEKRVDK